MIRAVLSNPSHPEYGVATIPLPIPHDQYARCMELLEALEIGNAVKADCKVQAIDSFYAVLKRTEMLTVNVEELNYLAKRLDSFDTGEAAQFQAMAHKLELFELKDLINLTFCCQQATVITDFSDLSAVGRNHYMNLHGGCAKTEELDALDGEKTARQLIENGNGAVTPYGVVYDNGMKLEQVYDGHFFPCYYYEPNEMSAHSRALSGQMAAAQKQLEEIDVLRRHIRNYAHTREVFQQYKASGYSKKFLEEHLQEIEMHRISKRAFNELGLKKLPSKKTLDAAYSQVLAEKKSLYAAYCEEQRKLKELLVHRENLRPYLAPQEPQTQKRKEQDER